MNLDLWKEKTKALFHIVEWTKFWNYIDNLKEENEAYENMRKEAIEIIDLIKPELWNISNKMTYKLIEIKNILNKVGGSDE